MAHTMRSAFKRWLILHNEEFRAHGYIRVPNWFRHYIRKNKEWSYTVTNEEENYYCNKCEMDWNTRRRFKGYYTFHISDEELLNLRRAEWIKTGLDERITEVKKVKELDSVFCGDVKSKRDVENLGER